MSHQQQEGNPSVIHGGESSAQVPQKRPEGARVGAGAADTARAHSGRALGNNAKRPSIQQNRGFAGNCDALIWTTPTAETGEVTPFTLKVNRHNEAVGHVYKTPQDLRHERWALKAVASELLTGTRVSKCHRIRAKAQDVRVMLDANHGKAFFAGLQTCGSVWGCPLCAAKISERRRAELEQAIEQAKRLGLKVMLLTLTVPHGLGDDLNTIVDGIIKAWDKTKSTRAGKALRDAIGLVGTVRAMEVTHGENGFHPHLHILLFLDKDMTTTGVQAGFSALWQDACVKVGLPRPSDRHGCRVDDGSKAAAYCSKWGLESEMTKGHTKTAGEGKGSTPFDFLRAFLHDDDKHAGKLFQVYYDCFKGRRQLCWSKGLKKLLLVADVTDEEIATQEQEHAVELAKITVDQWKAIYRRKLESTVLNIAENDSDALKPFLQSLTVNPLTMGKPEPPRVT